MVYNDSEAQSTLTSLGQSTLLVGHAENLYTHTKERKRHQFYDRVRSGAYSIVTLTGHILMSRETGPNVCKDSSDTPVVPESVEGQQV
jgi:hypothetical protein